jgi:hypothetical protein
MKAVTSSTIETVFSMESVQSAYKRREWQNSFRGSDESVVSWTSESRRIFSSEVPE